MIDLVKRDQIVRAFRRRVWQKTDYVPFFHQAEWQLATEGFTLLDMPPKDSTQPAARTLIYEKDSIPGESIIDRRTINKHKCAVVNRIVIPRIGGVAHVAADLAGYKAGKSYGMAKWAVGYAPLSDAIVQFVGLEYGTSEPEFNYLLDDLLSDRGMNMKYDKLQNDKRGGRMILKLRRGATFEVKSWNQKESLKGATISAYIYTECYQLPGIEVFTTISQNLRELDGHAIFGTTADRPWVKTLHDMGHGKDPDFHCTCSVDSRVNPFTFDQRARDRDDPSKGGIMTRERYAIAWEGKLGVFVGRVYSYQRGSSLFTPNTHPVLWPKLSENNAAPSAIS